MVAAQRNWSKKWQHVCHYNPHSFVLYYFIYFILDRSFSVSSCFLNLGWGCIFKEDSQQNHRPSLCAIITVSTLQRNPSANLICAFNLFCNFKILNPDQSLLLVHVCQLCLSVCVCLYMANCKYYKVWARQWCWWHLLSTDKHTFNYFFSVWKAWRSSEYSFSYYTHCYLLA